MSWSLPLDVMRSLLLDVMRYLLLVLPLVLPFCGFVCGRLLVLLICGVTRAREPIAGLV